MPMHKKKPKRLKDLRVNEISLVDKAANGRSFLLLKNEEIEMADLEIQCDEGFADVLKVVVDSSQELVEKMDGLGIPDESKFHLVIACNALQKAPGMEIDKALGLVAKALGVEMKTDEKFEKEDGSVDMEKIPQPIKKVMDQLFKVQENLGKENEELRKSLTAEKEKRDHQELVVKAKEKFGHIPLDSGEIARILKEAPEEGALYKVLSAAEQAFAQLVKPIGKDTVEDNTSAYAQLEKRAKEIQKDKGGSFEQAFVMAIDSNPELARQEVLERA